jgi:DNA helicase II / ATP-dependent DNA helicase PcrA
MSDYSEDDAFEAAAIPLSQRAMARPAMPYLDGLNPAQRQAVETLDGPVLMLAGAGTGKTKALTSRIAHVLATRSARPQEVLAVTFTNKAAREMKHRIAALMGEAVEGLPWLGTFHSVSAKLLRRHAELVGLQSSFTILDTDDQLRLLKQLVVASDIDEKRWPPRMLAGIIDGWKNKALTPDKVPVTESGAFDGKGVDLYAAYQRRLVDLNAVDFGDILLHMVTIFQKYPDVLRQYQTRFRYILVDEYQDTNVAQYLWLRLLAAGHKNICCVGDDDQSIYGWRGAEVGNILRFEADFPGAHVVRLEQNYRSTPHILAAASGVIAANKGRLGKTLFTAAKDGEKVRLIGHWDGEEEARWIGEEIEALTSGSSRMAIRRQNARSEQMMREIRRLSDENVLIGANSREQLFEKLENHKSFLAVQSRRDLIWELKSRSDEGKSLEPAFLKFGHSEIAILVRASHQMRAFEDRFLTIGLPYRVIGGPRFYERMEIRDAMAYFRLAVSPADDLAFERIVNTPKRGLGSVALRKIRDLADDKSVSQLEAARMGCQGKLLGGKGLKELTELVSGLDRWHRVTLGPLKQAIVDDSVIDDEDVLSSFVQDEPDYDHIELAQVILEESGYIDSFFAPQTEKEVALGEPRKFRDIEAPGRLENLKELVKALENFENLQGFLEHVSLIMDNDTEEAGEKVSIMTLHAAKGLEFPAVFLPGWEDGLFPSQRSMDESGLKGLEEERRLAYVGITRAEELCTISFAANRRVYGQWQSQMPSRFIDELPADHVAVLTPPGLYGGGFGAAGMAASASPAIMGAAGSDLHQKAHDADVYNSPGWRRLQTRSQQRGMAIPSEARNMTIDATAISAFSVDDRVFHQKFGYGNVLAIEGDKLEIAFDKAGTKHVVGRFIVSADAADDVPF